jgi:hypothetical protein
MGIFFAIVLSLFTSHDLLRAQSRLFINEFLASNSKLNADPDFKEYGDWVEIYNAGETAVPLVGYYLTDNLANPAKWKITANVTIPAKSYLVIWTDDRNTGLHANFKLSADGEQIGLFDYTLKLIDSITFTAQSTNVSCGRYPDGGSEWRLFNTPTPGAANTNQPFAGIVSDPAFSLASGFYRASRTVTISQDGTAEAVRYTLDGSAPSDTSRLYTAPIDIERTTVLRAQAFRSGNLPSRVITRTYFIGDSCTLPVVSLSTDPANLWDDETGIYVVGTKGITGYCMTTPCNWNQDWERPATLEYFDQSGQPRFQLDAGIKIGGGCTRKYPQKSLAVYARSIYGTSKITYPLFPDKNIETYNNLVLRNSGQDWYRTLFRDGMMQLLVKDRMEIDWQAYQPAVLFINGEYWGIHDLREKHNEHYLEANYGIDPDRVDIVSDNGEVHEGSATLYFELINYVSSHELAVQQNYEQVSARMDINEYLNYIIAEVYFANIDWPGGNIKFWRPWGEGNKWRWILFDTDLGFGAHALGQYDSNTLANVTSPTSTYYANPPWSTLLLRKLLANEEFRNRFIQRFAGHIQTTFEPARVIHKIDSLQAILAPEIPRHKQRWPTSISFSPTWETAMEITREFARKRPEHMMAHLAGKFSLAGTTTLTVKTNDPHMGMVSLEGVVMPDSLTLSYFRNIPLTCVALPAKGCRFAGWHGLDQSGEDTLRITLTSPATLTAIFAPEVVSVGEEAGEPVERFSLQQNWPNPFNPLTTIGFHLARPEQVTLKVYDIRGAEVTTLIDGRLAGGDHQVRFDASRLANGLYLYVLQSGRQRAVRKMAVVK